MQSILELRANVKGEAVTTIEIRHYRRIHLSCH